MLFVAVPQILEQEGVGENANTPDVRAVIVHRSLPRLTANFWGDVHRRSGHGLRPLVVGANGAHVTQLEVMPVLEEDVRLLHVPVKDVLASVQIVDRSHHL